MSVLVYIEHAEGSIKKTSLEAISYGKTLSKKIFRGRGSTCIGIDFRGSWPKPEQQELQRSFMSMTVN
jgi:hypothetical protein